MLEDVSHLWECPLIDDCCHRMPVSLLKSLVTLMFDKIIEFQLQSVAVLLTW